MDGNNGTEGAICVLHTYEQELRAKIEEMRDRLHNLQQTIEMLAGNENTSTMGKRPKAILGSSGASRSSYSELGGQGGVELFLRENPHWHKASTVAKELLRRGMKRSCKAWGSAITGSLNRAVGKGLAEKIKRNKVFVYRWKAEASDGQ